MKRKRKRRKKSHLYPKKPLTPFFLFSKDKRTLITEQVTKDKGKSDVAEVGRRLGALWHKLDDLTKKKYKDMFAKNKIEYIERVKIFKKKNPNINFYSDDEEENDGESKDNEIENMSNVSKEKKRTKYFFLGDNSDSSDDSDEPPRKRRKLIISLGKKKKKKKKKPSYLVEPQGGFSLFSYSKRQRLMKLEKYKNDKGGVDQDRITIDLSKMWGVLPDEEKQFYIDDNSILLEDYNKCMKKYQSKKKKVKEKEKVVS